MPFIFDGRNPFAQDWADKHAAQSVTAISEETRKALKALVTRAIREGLSPYEAARIIRGMVGLTASQAAGAMNYRAELAASGLSQERIDKALERYTSKKLRERAMVIARTETMSALNAGSLAGYEQAIQTGYLAKDSKKEWMTTPDEITCSTCEPLNGEKASMKATFSVGVQQPPAHPRCRCTFVVIAGVRKVEQNLVEAVPPVVPSLTERIAAKKAEDAALAEAKKQVVAELRTQIEVERSLSKAGLAKMEDLKKYEEVLQFDYGIYVEYASKSKEAIKAARTGLDSALRVLDKFRAAGVEADKQLTQIIIGKFPGGDTNAWASWRKQLGIDFRAGQWADRKQLLGAAKVRVMTQFGAGGSTDATIVHEMGHLFHMEAGASSQILPTSAQRVLMRTVSEYATTDSLEFVAETWSGILHGKQYSQDVMDLYYKWKGPRIPSSLIGAFA